ncbi:hypothetical protein K4T26_12360 [Staphylococcus epidermidis]|nr:hypothetical protein [Staphylococcus epidermidis]
MAKYTHIVADFETTVTEPVEVWLGCFSTLDEFKPKYSHSIQQFFLQLFRYKYANVYFHNLEKFDAGFIFNYLLSVGYVHLTDNEIAGKHKKYIVGSEREFTVYNGKNIYNFLDSVKLVATSIKQYGYMLMEDGKDLMKLDGSETQHMARKPTEYKQSYYDYIKNDVHILWHMMRDDDRYLQVENGNRTMSKVAFERLRNTRELKLNQPFKPYHKPKQMKLKPYEDLLGFDSQNQPIKRINEEKQQAYYDKLEQLMYDNPSQFARSMWNKPQAPFEYTDEVIERIKHLRNLYEKRKRRQHRKNNINREIRKAYRGGITYINPQHQNKMLGKLSIYDINSMYPAIMLNEQMVGKITSWVGRDKINPSIHLVGLYIVKMNIKATCKPDRQPIFKPRAKDTTNPYITTYEREINFRYFYMTNMEYDYLIENYDIHEIELISVMQFEPNNEIDFKTFISTQREIKENSTGTTRRIAKDTQNSSYGRFAYNDKHVPQHKYEIEDGVVVKKRVVNQDGEPIDKVIGDMNVDVQVAVFITAYARVKLGKACNTVGVDKVVYTDTDSLHMLGWDEPNLEIHPNKYGAWKLEHKARHGKYLQPKTYADELKIDGKWEWVFKQAGYNGEPLKLSEFELGQTVTVLRRQHVQGGILLRERKLQIGRGILETKHHFERH